MKGELCIVTGATSGIGKAIARGLAAQGARVVIGARSEERGKAACDEITAATGNAAVNSVPLDLCSLASVRDFAARFAGREGGREPVAVLVNNAGVMMGARELTADGLEATFQVNTVAPLLLASLLKPSLLAGAGARGGGPGAARVVYVGSRLEKGGKLGDLDTVSDAKLRFRADTDFSTFGTYATSKLAGTMLTYELARRWAREGHAGVAVTACTPGMVHTGLGRFAPWWQQWLTWPLRRLLLRTADKGAETPLHLCLSGDPAVAETGKYWGDMHAIESSPASYDEVAAGRMWATCEAMVGEELR